MFHHVRSRLRAPRVSLTLTLTLGLLGAPLSQPVLAQEIGRRGNLSFGGERLFGIYLVHRSVDSGPVERDSDGSVIGLGWSFGAGGGGLLGIPRLGVDYFLDDHLTLGGSFGMAAVSRELGDAVGVLLAGRVGYALRIDDTVSFWPRGGLSFATVGDGPDVLALTLEGNFSLAPARGWAFLVGPLLDLGFTGSVGDSDYTEIVFGVMFGITGWVEL